MSVDRIIIIGASGTIGAELYDTARREGLEVIGTFNSSARSGLIKFDLLRDRIIKEIPNLGSRDTVIFLAAAIDPDWVYKNQEMSNRINVEATIGCINEVINAGGRVLFISSEAVYSRDKESGYKETDEPNPATIYAQQKVKVERHLLNLPRAGIIRLGRNVGWSQSNFYCPVQLTYNALLSGQAKMAADNLITLTDVRDSVKGILHAANIEFNGILHLASEPPICRTALADRIIQTSRRKRAMSYEKILFSELGFDETKSRAAWLDSTLSCEELGCVYRTPTDVISEKVCAIDEWQTQ